MMALVRVAWAQENGWPITDWTTKAVDRTWNILDELEHIARELNTSVAAVALRWLMQQPGVTSTIIGVETLEELEQNMKAVDIHLSDSQMERLARVSDTAVPYPYNIVNIMNNMTTEN